MDMALTGDKLASMRKDGLKATATLSASAGIYQVRIIVRERVKRTLAAITTPIEVGQSKSMLCHRRESTTGAILLLAPKLSPFRH